MHPAPIGVADRTRKKTDWRTVPGQLCLLAEGDIGAPIYWRTDAPRANSIGEPMRPVPLKMEHRTLKILKNVKILNR
jgi:hypothetical protein